MLLETEVAWVSTMSGLPAVLDTERLTLDDSGMLLLEEDIETLILEE